MSERAARAERYRNKAEEVRLLAESMKDPEAKRFLITVAGDYLMLADMVERSHVPDPLPARE